MGGYSTGAAFEKALADAVNRKLNSSVDWRAEYEKLKAFVDQETSLRVVKALVLADVGTIEIVLGAR